MLTRHPVDTGRAPVLAGRPARLRFRITGEPGARLGRVFRVTIFDPILIGRFRVVGWVGGGGTCYVLVEALPGTLAHPTFMRMDCVALDVRHVHAISE